MKRIYYFLVYLVLFSCLGCTAHMNSVMKSWEGKHYSDLIASWGPPTQTLDDGQSGKIYCYQDTVSYTSPGYATTTGNAYLYGNYGNYQGTTYYNPPQTQSYQRYRMFWVNQEGYVYRWSWRGL